MKMRLLMATPTADTCQKLHTHSMWVLVSMCQCLAGYVSALPVTGMHRFVATKFGAVHCSVSSIVNDTLTSPAD